MICWIIFWGIENVIIVVELFFKVDFFFGCNIIGVIYGRVVFCFVIVWRFILVL